jgi:hypothetical protein|tara:strand:+ start:320 stop:505 length:186 start_codon:yes stop_codon:yes gene_type:complete
MTPSRLVFLSCLAVCGEAGLLTSPAWAHGSSAGSESGAVALLIFPVAAILFVIFFVLMRRK